MGTQSNLRTAGLFLLLIGVLVCGTWYAYRATTSIAESERWVAHTYQVMESLDSLILALQRTQNTADDYIATGNSDYLTEYRAASLLITQRLNEVRTLTVDNPNQQHALANLEINIVRLKSRLDDAVESRRQDRIEVATGDQQRSISDDIRIMKAREGNLLNARVGEAEQNLQTTRIGLLTGAAGNLFLLVLAAILVLRDQKQRWQIKESRLRLAAIVDSSDDAILSKKLDGTVTTWNAGAERLYGYTAAEIIGQSIYKVVPEDHHDELRSILERLAKGERIEHLETVRLRHDGSSVEVELTISPVVNGGAITGASVISRDITRRKQLERSLHQLTIGILQAQDEERRRIAREIHDTTVQKLALLSMNLAQLRVTADHAKAAANLDSSQKLASECVQELRTLSYVLHPPMLDELGLGSALKIYVEGIAQRSGIAIETEVDPAVERLDPEVEMALFRVAQESLSNVLRHSGSESAHIRLMNRDGIEISVSDKGIGMPAKPSATELPVAVGVGIPGMNERIRQLGGVLTITSGPGGTTVTARVPGRKAANA